MIINDDAGIKEILNTSKTIAVVGCSSNPERPAHYVPKFLQAMGHRIIPVNPQEKEILGEKCYASLRDITEPVDMVDCFRRAEAIPEIAEDAIAINAKVLWAQLDIINRDAAKLASDAGLKVVMDRCPVPEYLRLFPESVSKYLSLFPGKKFSQEIIDQYLQDHGKMTAV